MKWFKHYSNAHDNNKLTKLRARYGAEGYAIYWYCLELIAGELGMDSSINFELRHDAEVIGLNLKIDTLKVEEIMKFMVLLGLFEEAQGTITCLKLAKYLDKKTTRNETIREIIDAGTVSATVPDKPRLSPTNRDCPETSRLDTDTDTDTELSTAKAVEVASKPATCPHQRVIDLYHETLPALPRVKKWTPARKQQLRARWTEGNDDLEGWRRFFQYVGQSDFLMGRTPGRNGSPPFRADLAWLTKAENFAKVIEGKYHRQ